MPGALQGATDIRANELIEFYSHTRPDNSICFAAVNGSFSSDRNLGENIAAAQLLHISQPALSRQLVLLEEELEKKLLVRVKRQITLAKKEISGVFQRCTTVYKQY